MDGGIDWLDAAVSKDGIARCFYEQTWLQPRLCFGFMSGHLEGNSNSMAMNSMYSQDEHIYIGNAYIWLWFTRCENGYTHAKF